MGPEAAEPANHSAFSPCCKVRLPLFRIFGQIIGSRPATLFKYLNKWASTPRCHNWIFRFEDTGKVWFLGSNNPANPNQNPKYAVSIVAQLGTTKTGSIDEKIWGEIHVVLFLTYILTVWPNFLPCGLISDTEANFSVPVSGILAFLRTLSSPNFRRKNIRTYLLHRQIKESYWGNAEEFPWDLATVPTVCLITAARSFWLSRANVGFINVRYSGTFSSITKHISCCRLILLDVWPYFAEQCCQISDSVWKGFNSRFTLPLWRAGIDPHKQ